MERKHSATMPYGHLTLACALLFACLAGVAHAQSGGIKPYTLTAADAAAINNSGRLLPDYLPHHVAAGDMLARRADYVIIPVLAPSSGDVSIYEWFEVIVPANHGAIRVQRAQCLTARPMTPRPGWPVITF